VNKLNDTHNPGRRSWVLSANLGETDFPIQNLPFGRFRIRQNGRPQCGVAIGDQIFILSTALELGLFSGEALEAARAAAGEDLLPLLVRGNGSASALREQLSGLLTHDGAGNCQALADQLLVAQADVDMMLPTAVRQFSDMCVSTFHIGNFAGMDERGQPVCPPVFRTLPVGYDGRASSVVISETPVHRPNGSWQEQLDNGSVVFGPEPRQDYELEMGIWLGGPGNKHGEPFNIREASNFHFGLCLLNDWSARGIQFWEAMLGPFLGKNLATTISPWIVTSEALAPFTASAFDRPEGDPEVPRHLDSERHRLTGGFDIKLESYLLTSKMREEEQPDILICSTNFRHMYWTVAQIITHHASNGCSLAAGDLIGSGTCSGPGPMEAACLAEMKSTRPITFPNGESRMWIEDGDTIILRGRAERIGFVSIGFGAATGMLMPALAWPQ